MSVIGELHTLTAPSAPAPAPSHIPTSTQEFSGPVKSLAIDQLSNNLSGPLLLAIQTRPFPPSPPSGHANGRTYTGLVRSVALWPAQTASTSSYTLCVLPPTGGIRRTALPGQFRHLLFVSALFCPSNSFSGLFLYCLCLSVGIKSPFHPFRVILTIVCTFLLFCLFWPSSCWSVPFPAI